MDRACLLCQQSHGTWRQLCLKIHRHGWSKISVFKFLFLYYSLIIHHNWFQKNVPSQKWLIPVKKKKKNMSLNCQIQLSPVFQFFKTFHSTQICDLTFEWRHFWNEGEPRSNPEKDTSTQCLCTNISKTIELKQ